MDFPQTAFYLSKDNYLEVTAKHVSKEHALLEVAKYYDLPLEEVMTIGDNFNDSPMLALAGLGIAMGNAPEGVKETANLVTASNDEHGVAQAITEHVLK
jgi:hydroxymethylpyrimidine pyrophosphatase-like HAD family hydrolase